MATRSRTLPATIPVPREHVNRGERAVFVAAGPASGLCGHGHGTGEQARACADLHAEQERMAGRPASDRVAYVLHPRRAALNTRTDRAPALTHARGKWNGWRHR